MHIDFNKLPPPVRAAVQAHTGTIRYARSVKAGINSTIASILDTESAGHVYLKGVPEQHDAVMNQQREARVSPHVEEISPRMLWQETASGWDLIAFTAIEAARHADYAPGSPDLAMLAAVLNTLAELPCPPVPMMSAERRWGAFLDNPADVEHLAGASLLHTDYNEGNVLITKDRAWLVDWAWATRGAAFIDLACLIPRLIAAGHSLDEAEAWAAKHAVWQNANPLAINTFSHAIARMWRHLADSDPQATWRRPLVEAAASWATHRAETN